MDAQTRLSKIENVVVVVVVVVAVVVAIVALLRYLGICLESITACQSVKYFLLTRYINERRPN